MNYEKFYKPHWTKEERENVKVVIELMVMLNAQKFDEIISKYADSKYVQHSPTLETGVKSVSVAGKKMTKRFPETMLEIKHMYVDGGFVIANSHGTLKPMHRGNDKKGLNLIDVWKVVDGKMVEHWDSIVPLDFAGRLFNLFTGGIIRNHNGVF